MNAAFGLRADFFAPVFLAAFLAGIVGFSSWKGPPRVRKTGRTLTGERTPSKGLFPSEGPLRPSGRLSKRAAVKPFWAWLAEGRTRLGAAKEHSPPLGKSPFSTRASASRRRARALRLRGRAARAPRATRGRTLPRRPRRTIRPARARRSRAGAPRRDGRPERRAAWARRGRGRARCAARTRCREGPGPATRRRRPARGNARRAAVRRIRTGSRTRSRKVPAGPRRAELAARAHAAGPRMRHGVATIAGRAPGRSRAASRRARRRSRRRGRTPSRRAILNRRGGCGPKPPAEDR